MRMRRAYSFHSLSLALTDTICAQAKENSNAIVLTVECRREWSAIRMSCSVLIIHSKTTQKKVRQTNVRVLTLLVSLLPTTFVPYADSMRPMICLYGLRRWFHGHFTSQQSSKAEKNADIYLCIRFLVHMLSSKNIQIEKTDKFAVCLECARNGIEYECIHWEWAMGVQMASIEIVIKSNREIETGEQANYRSKGDFHLRMKSTIIIIISSRNINRSAHQSQWNCRWKTKDTMWQQRKNVWFYRKHHIQLYHTRLHCTVHGHGQT